MASLSHELLVELFRRRPALAGELLRACAGIRLPDGVAELASIDLSEVAPPEYRSDALVVLRDGRRAVAAVIVEVQLRPDPDKLLAWPVYLAAARARLGCPVTLLVIAPTPAVARWASRAIELGPGSVLRPVVVGFREVPCITRGAQARAAPELAVLSALAHPELAVVRAALRALAGVQEDAQRLYWDVIHMRLPADVRQALEASMTGYKYQSTFARKYYGQGLKEGHGQGLKEGHGQGLKEGHKEGHDKGLKEGEAIGLRKAIVELVCVRVPRLREDLTRRLRGLSEPVLKHLVVALSKARTERAVRATLDRVLGAPAPRRRRTTGGLAARRPATARA